MAEQAASATGASFHADRRHNFAGKIGRDRFLGSTHTVSNRVHRAVATGQRARVPGKPRRARRRYELSGSEMLALDRSAWWFWCYAVSGSDAAKVKTEYQSRRDKSKRDLGRDQQLDRWSTMGRAFPTQCAAIARHTI
jgi:hypothetical protein